MSQDQNDTVIWRSMLQLSQAAYAVLEREAPEMEGVPACGLPVLRLLRWHGPKTAKAIATFLGVAPQQACEIADELCRRNLVDESEPSDDTTWPTLELTGPGVQTLRQVILAQRQRVQRAIECLAPEERPVAARIMEVLAFGLAVNSTGFGITCSACWAHDPRECLKPDADQDCSLRVLGKARLDPDLSDGDESVPIWCPSSAASGPALDRKP